MSNGAGAGSRAVRWGILGTANIARGQFLPALHQVGDRAVRVASRDAARAAEFAKENGVEEGVKGYASVTESEDIDAVYIALPNSLHAEWAARAIDGRKAVLCEKMLCIDVAQTVQLLDHARAKGALLWEAFVFPFQEQHKRLLQIIGDGVIGDVREITSSFHFRVSNPRNIRLSRNLGGGALADVGCYPVRLAQEVYPDAVRTRTGVLAVASMGAEVETEMSAVVSFGSRALSFTCGFNRSYDTFTRILGDEGQVHLTNPYHPKPFDTITVRRADGTVATESPTRDEYSFMAAISHVGAVLRGEEAPRQLAADRSLETAETIAAVAEASMR